MSDITIEVYEFIQKYIEVNNIPPSQREIAKACLIAPSSVIRYLDILEARGQIKRIPNVSRGISLTNSPES